MSNLLVKRGHVKDYLSSQHILNTVYIGRANKTYNLPNTHTANPFVIGKDGTREEVVEKYRKWLWEKIQNKPNPVWLSLCGLLNQIKKREEPLILTCWCKENEKCHGDVVISCLNWMNDNNLGE